MNNETGKEAMQEASTPSHVKLVRPQVNFGRSVHIARLIHQFGGAKKLAKICKCSSKLVYCWTDHVSAEPAWHLLAYARRNGFDNITLESLRPDLDFGKHRESAE